MIDTIFAPATAPGRAGVAVIRVSGPLSWQAAQALSSRAPVEPRRSFTAKIIDPSSGALLDYALILPFRAPASFTGEDTIEFHLHGGKAVVQGVLKALSAMSGLRMAEPGEFTKRAFQNNKIDLTEAEAVADLIAAETDAQRHQALEQLGGALSSLYRGWTDRLAKILAHQEADIEFPEDDLPSGLADVLRPAIEALLIEFSSHLDDKRRGERLRDGIRIAIVGAPNAGKSSLLNALAQRDAAIVSDEAGTTRDIIEIYLDLGGYPVILADTAGLRDTHNAIEAEGIRRAQKWAADADLTLALFDGTQSTPDAGTMQLIDDRTIVVLNKSDRGITMDMPQGVAISAASGDGVDALLKLLSAKVADIFGDHQGGVALTRERHRAAITAARDSLQRSIDAPLPELAAEDIRMALRDLGSITGRVHVEDLLDRIFRDFCIGK